MAVILFDIPGKEISLEDICFTLESQEQTFTAGVKQKYNKKIQELHEENRRTTPPQFDADNSPMLAIDRFYIENEKRNFQLQRAEFRDYFALKHLIYENCTDKDLFQQFMLLSSINILETSDNYLVLGFREGEHLSGKYLPPAGFLPCPQAITPDYFAEKCREEFKEEVGIIYDDEVTYIGLTADTRDSFLAVGVFYGKTPQTHEEVHNAWDKSGARDEHSHLIYLPAATYHISTFIEGMGSGDLNLFDDIFFVGGTCISGPPEILGKKYQQIENGIGALIAYLALKLTPEQLDREIAHLTAVEATEIVYKKPTKDKSPNLLIS